MKPILKTIGRLMTFATRYVGRYFDENHFVAYSVPKIAVEITNICNSRCAFCANRIMKRRKQHMEMGIFKKAVNECADMGLESISFNTVIGDPLCDPHLLERARYVRRFPSFKSLGFVTSLQELHNFDLNEFLDSGFTWLSISATLSGREKYRQFFGVDRYDIFLKNLLAIINENNKRKKIFLRIDIKHTDEPIESVLNHPDFKLVTDLVKLDLRAAVENRGLHVDDWGGTVDLPHYLRKRPLYMRMFRPCNLIYRSLVVFSNGNVGACSCRDFEADSELILGNLESSTIKEMWEGARLDSIRANWREKNKIPDICRNCRHYLY